jgi:hypothetical protein
MVTGMPVALRAASLASLSAGPHSGSGQARVKLRLPAEKTPCRGADIAAIETEPNAADHRLDIRFTEGSIRTGDAGHGAVDACLDARNQNIGFDRDPSRMRVQHLTYVCHRPSFRQVTSREGS